MYRKIFHSALAIGARSFKSFVFAADLFKTEGFMYRISLDCGCLFFLVILFGGWSASAMEPAREEYYRSRMDLLRYKDGTGKVCEIRTLDDWFGYRPKLIENFECIAGAFPQEKKRPNLEMKVLEEVCEPEYIRRKISFVSESKDLCFAWLLIPKNILPGQKRAAMVCAHPTHAQGKDVPVGLANRANRNYSQELTQRGYVTISPDYWSFGDHKNDPYKLGYKSVTMKGVWDHSRCVDLLQSLSFVDGERIGIIGHSLGGHNAIFAAVFDSRFKVVVTSCGFTSFHKYYQGRLAGWSQDRYMPIIRTVYADNPDRVPSDFNQLLALLAPRPIFVNAPRRDGNFEFSGVMDCIESAEKVYELYEKAGKINFSKSEKTDGQTEVYKGIFLRHPDCEHDFPPAEREAAYRFLDRFLVAPGQ